jgi:hypothetical protein
MKSNSEAELGNDGEARSEEDDLMIIYLAQGWTHQQVAGQVGVSTKTVQRRMADPGFAAAVTKRRRERVGQLSGQLITATDGAVIVLRNALDSDDPKVSLRAATLILDHANRFHRGEEEREMARRQDELEQGLQDALDALAVITGGTNPGEPR